MKVTSQQLRLYAVTDRAWAVDTAAFLRQIEDAIDGGATIVQLREKHLTGEALTALAEEFVALCRRKGVISIINDDVELALQVGADGVHVGQEDLAAGEARAKLGADKIIGVSVHNAAEALRALEAGADYLGSGAAFVSDTKSEAKPITRQTLQAVTAATPLPVVAIGGITKDNILQLSGCGLSGVAVVSALFAQPDVKAAAQELLALSERMVTA